MEREREREREREIASKQYEKDEGMRVFFSSVTRKQQQVRELFFSISGGWDLLEMSMDFALEDC